MAKMADGQKRQQDTFWVQEGTVKDFWTFILAINWKESWIIAAMAIHVLCFIAILLTRKYTNVQFVLFVTLSGIAFMSERINKLGAKHWRLFANEQYFDSYGLFILVILSGPIMFNCLILVIIWLFDAGQLLIKIKRRQLLRVDTPTAANAAGKKKSE